MENEIFSSFNSLEELIKIAVILGNYDLYIDDPEEIKEELDSICEGIIKFIDIHHYNNKGNDYHLTPIGKCRASLVYLQSVIRQENIDINLCMYVFNKFRKECADGDHHVYFIHEDDIAVMSFYLRRLKEILENKGSYEKTTEEITKKESEPDKTS